MLTLTIAGQELYDEITEKFVTLDPVVLELEHSLISLSKWESEHEVPFLTAGKKSTEEIFDYIRSMILNPKISPEVISQFTSEDLQKINDYIDSKQSATTFGQMPGSKARAETITSELIYYWMVAYNIPFECETWHLNRLFALIRICNVKNSKPKKMSRNEIAARNRALNDERRARLGTRG